MAAARGKQADVEPDVEPVEPAPEKVRPRRYYRPGDRAPGRLYGTLDPQGRITPTGNDGQDTPPPGARGVVIATREGRRLTALQTTRLNG